ncbi:MAG: hypothetical protein HNEKOMLI_00691 [Sodalis sp. Psp]|nr:hypothetical protein [Sodalis sp. Psp]
MVRLHDTMIKPVSYTFGDVHAGIYFYSLTISVSIKLPFNTETVHLCTEQHNISSRHPLSVR